MADATKLLTYGNLQTYDGLIKQYISDEDAKSIHKVLFDSTSKKILFYKDATATVSDTADFEVDIPADLDGSATIASVSSGVVTLKAGITEADGIVSNNSDSDIVLAKVATTGAAEDVSIADAGGLISATDVEGALQELAAASAGGVASKTVYITETSGTSSDPFSKKYGIYQGSTGSSASPVAGEKLADIDIPKDMVVESGSVVDIVFKASDSTLHEGSESGTDVTAAIKGTGTATAADAGKYIKLVIANSSSTALYIKATDLVDIYTTEQNASQIQLTIDSNNVISAEIVDGSVDTDALGASAVTTAKIADANVTTAKIADDAVTADKVAISAHTESVTAGADGIAVSVTTTDGQVSAVTASIAANTYDAYGAASSAVAALDSNTSSATNTTDSGLTVLTEVGIVDGLITTKKTHTLGGAADKAADYYMVASDYTEATTADIEDLFD